jgi:hypothetical protein
MDEFDVWWQSTATPIEQRDPHIRYHAQRAWQDALIIGEARGRVLGMEEAAGRKIKTATPRELPRCGSGGLHDEQQYCFEKGWKEGQAVLRKAIRQAAAQVEGKNAKAATSL